MGNDFCTRRNNPKPILYNDEELSKLQHLYNKLKSRFPEQQCYIFRTYKKDYLSEECLEYLLPDKPEITSKLFQYMSDNGQTIVNLPVFMKKISKLTKSESNNRKTKTEQYAAISISRINLDNPEYDREKISYFDALDFIIEIEYFLTIKGYYVTNYEQFDESTARSILQTLFATSTGSILFYELTTYFEQCFPNLSNFISRFFYQLIFSQTDYQQVQRFFKPSYLMNNSQFGYISLCSPIIYESEHMELIWTSGQFGWNFESLYQSLIAFKGPTLILLKFDESSFDDDEDEEKQVKSQIQTKKYSIMAAFNPTQWIETNSYQGASQSCLYQVYPSFRYYPVNTDVFKSKRLNSQNYAYLNKQEKKKGLGYGGDLKSYRVWVDAEYMQQASFAQTEGEPYLPGNLIDPSIVTPSLTYIEAWGIGDNNKTVSSVEEEMKVYRISTNELLLKYQ